MFSQRHDKLKEFLTPPATAWDSIRSFDRFEKFIFIFASPRLCVKLIFSKMRDFFFSVFSVVHIFLFRD